MAGQLVQWLQHLAIHHPNETISVVEVGPGEAELSCDLMDHFADQLPDLSSRLELVLILDPYDVSGLRDWSVTWPSC